MDTHKNFRDRAWKQEIRIELRRGVNVFESGGLGMVRVNVDVL